MFGQRFTLPAARLDAHSSNSTRPHAFSDPEINFGSNHGIGAHQQLQQQQPQSQQQQQQLPLQSNRAFDLTANRGATAYNPSSAGGFESLFHAQPQTTTQPPEGASTSRFDSTFPPSHALPSSLFSFMHTQQQPQQPTAEHSAHVPQHSFGSRGGEPLLHHPSASAYSSSSASSLHPHVPNRAASASPVASSGFLHGAGSFYQSLGLSQVPYARQSSYVYDKEEEAEDLELLSQLRFTSSQSARKIRGFDSNSPRAAPLPYEAMLFPSAHSLSPPQVPTPLLATPPLMPSFLTNNQHDHDDK